MTTTPSTSFLAGLLLAALLGSCFGRGDEKRGLKSVQVTPTAPTIASGTTQAFQATGIYHDGSKRDLTASVTWSSADLAVATVTSGVALGLAPGPTTVTATHRSGVAGSTPLTVTPAVLTSISLTPTLPGIALGTGVQLTATGTFSDGSVQDLTAAVTWGSSSPEVATVGNAAGIEGLATSVAVGVTTVTATDPSSGIDGNTTLTVTPAVLLAIAAGPTNPSIALGTSQAFTATGTFSDSTVQDLTGAVAWSSAEPGVATVGNAPGSEGFATSVSIGATAITATDPATGISGSTILSVTPAVLAAVGVTPPTPSVALGTDLAFAATGTFSNGSTQDLTDAVTWSSTSPAVASVSNAAGSAGLAASLSTGATTITATDPGTGIDGSASLTVSPAVLTSIAVTPAAPSIALGTVQQLAGTGTYSDGSTQDLTAAVAWSSTLGAVATVSNAPGSEGLVTSVSTGATWITATDPVSGIDGSTTLDVTSAALVSIAVTPPAASIALGTNQALTATGTYTDGSTQDLTDAVTWSSTLPAVATVSNAAGTEGLATSLSVGVTTVGVVDPGTAIATSTTLAVTPAVLVSVAVAPEAPSIALGTTQQLAATGTYSDGTTQDLTNTATWSSTLGAVATVSNAAGTEGLATSASIGATTIRATDPGTSLEGVATLTVTPAVLVSIAVTPAGSSAPVGSAPAFTATGSYSDGSTQDLTGSVTWSSSDPAVATISNASGSEGLAFAASVGSSTIAATDVATSISGSTGLAVIADITFRDAASGSATGAKPLVVPTPAAAQPGDLLVAAVAFRPSSTSITPPPGWTLVRRVDNPSGNSSSLAVYWRAAAIAEPANHTWSLSNSTGVAGGIAAFLAVDSVDPVDVEDGQSTPLSLTHTTPSVTTTRPDTMVVTAHALSSSAAWVPPLGMTEALEVASLAVPNEAGISLQVSYTPQPSPGATGTKAALASAGPDTGNALVLALSPP